MVREDLEAFTTVILDGFLPIDQRRWGQAYVHGLLLEGQRKSAGAEGRQQQRAVPAPAQPSGGLRRRAGGEADSSGWAEVNVPPGGTTYDRARTRPPDRGGIDP